MQYYNKKAFIKFYVIYIDILYSYTYNEYMNNHSNEKQQKNLYALYRERESKKGSYMEENVEQISINVEKVNKIKSNFPDEDLLFDIAENFKVFGDSTRMKIIAALLEEELNVSEIAAITNSTPSAISHQLRVLKQAKLVKGRKDGKAVYYSLDDDHVRKIYEIGKEHIEES